ncbi:MAG TPA: type II toxin-antitoxin system PemK/MazF family toxin [Acidobacteriaceae bacterium]|nr:type II toxin-antitoxin system PemK/MazF family toxin [Acidobacteriaceae bacterium]
MRRGDLVTVSLSGDYGKPRPALIMQDDAFDLHPSVTVLPLTSELHDAPLFRVTVDPSRSTGLRKRSQVMVDKTITVPRSKLGEKIGAVDKATLAAISDALRVFLGL